MVTILRSWRRHPPPDVRCRDGRADVGHHRGRHWGRDQLLADLGDAAQRNQGPFAVKAVCLTDGATAVTLVFFLCLLDLATR